MDFLINNSYRDSIEYQHFVLNNIGLLTLGNPATKVMSQDVTQAHKGDYYGLLARLEIDSSMWWVIAAMNGIKNNWDFDGDATTIIIPSGTALSKLDKMFLETGV